MNEQIQVIPLKDIIPSKTNPRNSSDYRAEDLLSLALSIKENGLIQPVRVRPNPGGKTAFELIVGERRFRASMMKESGKTDILAVVCDYDDDQVLVAQNIENIQRKDVHAMDEAMSLKSLMEIKDPKTKAPRFTVEALAVELGKSKSYVWQSIVLVDLIPALQKLFRKNRITKQIAMMLARQTKEQQETLQDWVENVLNMQFSIDPDDLKAEIEGRFHLELDGAPFDLNDHTLVEKAGPCVLCPKSTANAPDLFGDLGKKPLCTDSACFKLKKQATFDRNMKALRSSKERFVIVNPYRHGSKNILSRNEYKPVKAGTKGAVKAIHADEKRRGAIEWVKPYRIPMVGEESNAASAKSKDSSKAKSEAAMEKQRAEQERKKNITALAGERIMLKLLKAAPAELNPKQLETIAEELLDNMQTSGIDALIRGLGGDPESLGYREEVKYLRKKDIHPVSIIWLMMEASDMLRYPSEFEPKFLKLCSSAKVDYKQIIAQATEEVKMNEQKEKQEEKEQPVAKPKSGKKK